MKKLVKLTLACISFFYFNTAIGQTPTVPSGFTIRTVASGGILAGQILDGIVADPISGNVYVAGVTSTSSSSFNLYKITPAGVVSLIANYPFSHSEVVKMAIGPDGMIYTVDGGSGTMRKIDPTTGTSSIFANGQSGGRYGLNFDPAGNLIISHESITSFFKVTPAGNVLLGNLSANPTNSNHGDAFGIQPNGNYVVYVDCGGQNHFSINTAGHVIGTNYSSLAWIGTTNIFASLMPGGCGYSNGAIDPQSGNVYSTISNFGAGNTRILFTGANGGATSLFVDGASGITDLSFGRESSLATCNSLYFVDRNTNKVFEVPMNNCCTPTPTAVSVNGGGTFCGSTTITASGGIGGTMYFQGTTDNGTSTATPATSAVVTSSGTYYFRSLGPTGCWSAQGSVVVTNIQPSAPVISPAGNIAICSGNQVTLSVAPITSTTTTTYNIPLANLVNFPNTCGTGSYYGSGQSGFDWNDVNSGPVTNVQVKFSVGVECTPGAHTTTLNTVSGPGFTTTGSCTCSNPASPQIITLNLNTANYNPGGVNTFLTNSNTFGLIPDASLAGNYAQVIVTYSSVLPIVWSPGGATTNSITVSPATTTTYTVTVTGTGGCTNAASKIVTVSTPTATITADGPTTFCSGGSVTLTANAGASYLWSTGATTQSILVTTSGNYSVTVTDANNCSATSAPTTVTLNTLPTISCPGNINVNNIAGTCNAVVNYSTSATGSPAPVTTYQFTGATTGSGNGDGSGSSFNGGITNVTVTATNTCGTQSCSFTVTVTDNEPPVFAYLTPPPSLATSNVPEANGYNVIYQLDIPLNSDYNNNAIPYTVNNSAATGAYNRVAYFLDLGTKWVWVSMDKFNSTLTELGIPNAAYNDVAWQRTVSNMNVTGSAGSGVTNATGIPGNIEMWHNCYGSAAGLAGIPSGNNSLYDFNDNRSIANPSCYGSFQVHNYGAAQTLFAYNSWDQPGSAADDLGIGNQAGGSGHPDWTYAYNTPSYTTRKLYILVNSGSCPPDITVNVTANTCGAVVNYPTPAGSDNCSGVTTAQTAGLPSGSVFPVGPTTNTFVATAANGQTATCNFTVTVIDNINPTITCPAPLTVQCASAVPVPNTALVTANDNCSAVVTFVSDVITAGNCINQYTIARTYKATDPSGNFATCTQTITVNDNTAPVITCPANITVNNAAGMCGANVSFTATATDNCGSVTITYSQASGSFFAVGPTTVTATATDACGNSSTCTFTVTVIDNEDPVINGQNNNITMNFNAGSGTPPSYTEAGITFLSLYGGGHVHLGDNNGDGSPDIMNHSGCCSTPYRLTVGANVQFTLISMQVKQVSSPPGTFYVFPSGASVTINSTGLFTFPAGFANVTEVRWQQDAGQTVIDNMIISSTTIGSCPADIVRSNDAGQCGAIVNYSASVTDNCSATLAFSPPSGSFFAIGVTPVTATATDPSGNTSSCTFNVTVNDNQSPTVTAAPDVEIGRAHV